MTSRKYAIITHPKISKIYLVWDSGDDVDDRSSKCVFIFIGGELYRLLHTFASWRDVLSTVSYTHSSGIYTLSLTLTASDISYWGSRAVFDSIESLIEDLKVRALLEAL